MDADYESIVLVKNEVFVYQIPPRTSNRNYRAADWKLESPSWTGRLRLISKSDKMFLKLEDQNSCQLFAQCPIETYPGPAIEPVSDSSRYFVIRVVSERGDKAFIGLGFADRGDSFDLNVSLQDHFKKLKAPDASQAAAAELNAPKLDLSFKAGETIKINIGGKSDGGSSSRPRRPQASSGGGIGLLPPPPGPSSRNRGAPGGQSGTIAPPPSNTTLPVAAPPTNVPPTSQIHSTAASASNAKQDDWSDFLSQQTTSQSSQPSKAPVTTFEDPLLQF